MISIIDKINYLI